jgi:hypothetical protein
MFILKKSSPEPAGQFQSNLVQIILGLKEIKIVLKKRPGFFPRGDNHINAKMGWDHLKIFSRTAVRRAYIYRKAF